MTAKRIVPNGDAITRRVPTPASSGAAPTPTPTTVTLSPDTTLVSRLSSVFISDTTLNLAPGWSY